MKTLRLRIACAFAKMMGVPIKVRESFWFGPDQLTGEAQSGQTP